MNKKTIEAFLTGVVILLFGFVGSPVQVTRGIAKAVSGEDLTSAQTPLLSPRLLALQKELEANSKAALESFWQEVAKKGTPLVEPTPDQDNYLYVTFLWRGKEGTENVIVDTLDQNNQLADSSFFPQARMTLLPGSDVWYRTYRLRNDARFSYRVSPNDALTLLPDLKPEEQAKRLATLQPDPLNPRHYLSRNGDSSVVELPKAPPQPWIQPLPGVPAGRVEKTNFKSAILNNERQVWVYTPPGFKRNGQPYPLVVTFDGETYVAKAEADGMAMPTTLDNLLAKGKMPPVVAVMIGNAAGARIKELWYHEPFNEFLAKELIPWVRQKYHVTVDPRQTAVAGLSLGGGASLFAGFSHPEIFGNIISQSGGNMYRQTREAMAGLPKPGQVFFEEDFPESEWLTRQIARRPKVPVRFYLEAGLLEDLKYQVALPRFAHPSLILATRHLRDVLQARGYTVFYNEYNGAHETLSWRGTLADALVVLLGKGNKGTFPPGQSRQAR